MKEYSTVEQVLRYEY